MIEKIKPPRGTPGEIYKSISVDSRDFSIDENKLFKKKENGYILFCKNIYKKFPGLGKNGKYNTQYKSAVDFLRWDLKAEEYTAGTKFVLLFGIFTAIVISFLIYMYGLESLKSLFGNIYIPIMITFGMPIIIFIYIFTTFQKYPLTQVSYEKVRALTFVPEILGYMIMSMKLVPNLEKAIEFASNHGHGKIADDLKSLLWEVKVGIKGSVAEALDDLAYKWGEVSEELKKALMKIRSSVIEVSEAKRYQILDQTMDDTLISIKGKLEDYARSLSQPSMVIFYIGVLLPLLLIIILPIGSAFSGSALARPIYLILIYNFAIPIGCLVYARSIIRNRPATYVPAVIPDKHPSLPKKNTIKIGKSSVNVFLIIILVVGTLIIGSIFLQSSFGKTKYNVLLNAGYIKEGEPITAAEFNCSKEELALKAENPKILCQAETEFWQDADNDVTPYFLIYGLLIAFSLGFSLLFYSQSVYKRRIQLQSEKMEDEFKDALYIIASRLGENKPIEDALSHTRDFLSKSLISKSIFGKAIDNIRILGFNLNSALFDESYGALKNNPSTIINSAMRLMVDSVQLGVSVAAKTLMSYSMQLRNTDEVTKTLKDLISGITGTLNSMAKFIAPIVLGITTGLQKIVISTLTSISNSGALQEVSSAIEGVGSAIGGTVNTSSIEGMATIDPATIAQLASSTTFLIIVAIYVIEIVIIITYFTTMIEEDNIVLAKLKIARTLPIAIILFILTTIFTNMLF